MCSYVRVCACVSCVCVRVCVCVSTSAMTTQAAYMYSCAQMDGYYTGKNYYNISAVRTTTTYAYVVDP